MALYKSAPQKLKHMLHDIRIDMNAPVTASFFFLCLAAMLLNALTAGGANKALFSVYRASLADPLTYLRLVTHVFGHADWNHFFGNMLYIVILCPLLEERYGSRMMICTMMLTAFITGVFSFLLFPGIRMLGASGIVFSMIILSSFTRTRNGGIPFSFLLVTVIYLGQQVSGMLAAQENIAYLAHLAGGVMGGTAGFIYKRKHHE